MKQSIIHIALVVKDYDEAIDFYTKKLHFTLVEDTYQPEQDKRWVVIAPPGPVGTTILLAKASRPEQEPFIGHQAGGRVFLFLNTDDFWRDYHDMLANGIKFVREPKQAPYGTVAVFEDFYGNLWDLVELNKDHPILREDHSASHQHICPCGLNCIDCLFYEPEIYEAAEKLKKVIEKHDFATFLKRISGNYTWGVGKLFEMDQDIPGKAVYQCFESFKDMPKFLGILDNIVKLQCPKTCQEAGGCSVGGVTHKCDLMRCMEGKGYSGCWECPEFEGCDKLKLREGAYGDTIQHNLKTINKEGIEAVKPRGKNYYVWNNQDDKVKK